MNSGYHELDIERVMYIQLDACVESLNSAARWPCMHTSTPTPPWMQCQSTPSTPQNVIEHDNYKHYHKNSATLLSTNSIRHFEIRNRRTGNPSSQASTRAQCTQIVIYFRMTVHCRLIFTCLRYIWYVPNVPKYPALCR